jgi:hypothetical protein
MAVLIKNILSDFPQISLNYLEVYRREACHETQISYITLHVQFLSEARIENVELNK